MQVRWKNDEKSFECSLNVDPQRSGPSGDRVRRLRRRNIKWYGRQFHVRSGVVADEA